MEISDARKLKALEDENRRLKKLLAERVEDAATLREMLGKNFRGLACGGKPRPAASESRAIRGRVPAGWWAGIRRPIAMPPRDRMTMLSVPSSESWHRRADGLVSRLEWQQLRERNEALDRRVNACAAPWNAGADRWTDRTLKSIRKSG